MPSGHKQLIVCADDFGLDVAVNRAVEQAAHTGILTCASLMVGAPAAADAIARAKQNPKLKIGLHVTLTAGRAVLPHARIPDLVDKDGFFDDDMARAGARYFFLPQARRQLEKEIVAQFEAFAATGLPLDHVNAHRHFHLHPSLARMIVNIGRSFGMKAMRLPNENMTALRQAALAEGARVTTPLYAPWVGLLGLYLRRQKIAVNDYIFGLAWSGHMTEARVLNLLTALPDGVSELYLHPAMERTTALVKAMPGYQHVEEYRALVSAAVGARVKESGISLISYADLKP